jgi:hypothetical protein
LILFLLKINIINKGGTYIEHIKAERIAEAVKNGFTPTTDFSKAKDVDALIICVPTPLNKYREPDPPADRQRDHSEPQAAGAVRGAEPRASHGLHPGAGPAPADKPH